MAPETQVDGFSPTLASQFPPKLEPAAEKKKVSEMRRKSKTMLAGSSDIEKKAPAKQASPKKTMLGMTVPDAPLASTDPAQPIEQAGPIVGDGDTKPEAPSTPFSDTYEEEAFELPARGGSSRARWLLAGAGIIVALASAFWFAFGFGRAPDLEANYVWQDGGAKLEVTGANEGMQISWKEQTVGVRAGKATFRIEAPELAPGLQPFDLRWRASRSARWRKATVPVSVPFHVFADRERLSREPPELRVVVRAPKGSKVTLDERPISTNSDTFERVYTLKNPDPNVDHIVHHSQFTVVTPDGETYQGTLADKAPLAYIQVIQPPTKFVTADDTVVLRGRVQDGATVELDGTPLKLRSGLFHSLFRLQSIGQYSPSLTVSQEGFVPRHRQVDIRRVQDLRVAAAGFEADSLIDYAALTDRAAAVQGKPVGFSGYVYHSKSDSYETSVQVLLQECPTGDKCPAWVTYPSVLAIPNRTWVDIRGYADGFQKFRTKGDTTDSIPRIRAVFLLPRTRTAPTPPRRKATRKKRSMRKATAHGDVINPWR